MLAVKLEPTCETHMALLIIASKALSSLLKKITLHKKDFAISFSYMLSFFFTLFSLGIKNLSEKKEEKKKTNHGRFYEAISYIHAQDSSLNVSCRRVLARCLSADSTLVTWQDCCGGEACGGLSSQAHTFLLFPLSLGKLDYNSSQFLLSLFQSSMHVGIERNKLYLFQVEHRTQNWKQLVKIYQ